MPTSRARSKIKNKPRLEMQIGAIAMGGGRHVPFVAIPPDHPLRVAYRVQLTPAELRALDMVDPDRLTIAASPS